jgi:NAD(P)-dependent dehydrogenase (short-subunit alcohol dehydrogenase family)
MLKDKVIILTGACGTIGSETARCLTKNGAKVVLCDINEERLKMLKADIEKDGGICDISVTDITNFEAVKAMAKFAFERFGGIDILVNNAGGSAALINKISSFEDAEIDTLRFVINLNIFGTFHCVKAVLPYMKEQGKGKIINFSSIAGVAGLATRVDYSAAKGAILSFTKALAMEVGKYNITVNCISPGMIAHDGNIYSNTTYIGPDGHSGKPADIASAVLFFCLDGSDYITGENLLVDGGRTLGPRS